MANVTQILAEPRPTYGELKNFIGGKWVASNASQRLDDLNPASAKQIASVPLSTRDDVGHAVEEAVKAFDGWRATPPLERARFLMRFRELLDANKEELARLIVQDMGKTISEARGELGRCIENVEVATGIPSLMMGFGLEDGAGAGFDEEVVYQPLGVFAGISPFNFPLMIQSWFIPYALATGNTFIAKPSEQDPVPMHRYFELLEKAGFPPGVINLVNGGREAVDALIDHKDVRGISFVGSTPTAKAIYAKAAEKGKRVQCGGGAKNVLVVAPDAKVDQALGNMIASVYGCAGERCLAGSAVIALGDDQAKTRKRFTEAASKLRIGYGLDEAVDMGPVVSKAHQERVLGHIDDAQAEGAKVRLDGRGTRTKPGFFVGPTVLDGVTPDMKVAQTEVFGPVASFLEAQDLDDAIRIINASPFGNAATLYTSSGKAARDFRYKAQAGNIGINVGVAAPIAYFPFGGMKNSFFGDLHPQGRDAIRFYLDSKTVVERWL